ncbi:MAG TPA: TIM barrel protein [Gemmatimonadales bacterium]|nr:TIM barrel protein [Gemmatimonadales bacterium]
MTTRRAFLAGSAALLAAPQVAVAAPEITLPSAPPTGLKQAVTRWPFARMAWDDFCRMVKRLGFGAVDLVDEGDWATVQRHGLAISTANSSARRDFIGRGLNDRANHATILGELEAVIPKAAAAKIPNVIAMFGNGTRETAAEGIAACAEGLAKIAPLAERHGVTIVLEMLNSKVDHRGFQGDTTAYGVAVCERVNSARVRLLYDIYHMQIMEGDVIRTIRAHHRWFAHYHTAGNPGRQEIGDRQELQYPAIARAIAETGFTGWVAHEFSPAGRADVALREARQRMA